RRDHVLIRLVPLSSTVYLVLVCTSCASPPDLHSFPTRRSSDLTGRVIVSLEKDAAYFNCACPRAEEAQMDGNQLNLKGSRRSFLDRKSTRLNSSHGSISYAVFCLKKKTKKITKHMIIALE